MLQLLLLKFKVIIIHQFKPHTIILFTEILPILQLDQKSESISFHYHFYSVLHKEWKSLILNLKNL